MIKPKYMVKCERKIRVRKSIRKIIQGTPERPRLIIVKSHKFLYTQVVDDVNHRILTAASTLEKEVKSQLKNNKDKEAAKLLGKVIAGRLKDLKLKRVTFDRNIYPFMGRVKVFADSARENGINF